MEIVFHAVTWLGILLLAFFLITSTYRILKQRPLLPYFTIEEERAMAPKIMYLTCALLGIGYFGLSYLQGSLL